MSRRSGFTLIELVVVILILGILAAVAAPKMFNTSAKATDNGLKQSLNIIRDAIELYVSQNGGNYPDCDASGGATTFKVYLQTYIRGQFPKCPVGTAADLTGVAVINTVGATTADASPAYGWKYNKGTGAFICNYGAATKSDGSVTYDSL
jgi:general secretion pathway protein G